MRAPIHRLKRNGFLLVACIVAVLIQVAIPYVPGLAAAFNATPLDLGDWLVVGVVAFVPALLAEAARMRARGSRVWVA